MPSTGPFSKLTSLLPCCRPPAAPAGVTASGGGGSGETIVTWLPGPPSVARYRVYRQKGDHQLVAVGVVLPGALGILLPGRVGLVDAPDYWPWPTGEDGDADRTYRVTAVSHRGLESALSTPAGVAGPFS